MSNFRSLARRQAMRLPYNSITITITITITSTSTRGEGEGQGEIN
jgi:hypothetical protein